MKTILEAIYMKRIALLMAMIVIASIAGGFSIKADFYWTPENLTDLQEVHFYDNSTGNIVAWIWYFGDGNSSTAKNPVHRYADNGAYLVRLVVWDDNGNMDYAEKIINVLNEPPVADAGEDITTNSYTVGFNGGFSYDEDGIIINYTWDFGDGNFGYGKVVNHEYNDEGIYYVTLTVRDNDNATDDDDIEVLIDVTPPETNYSIEEEKEWYNEEVEITLNATDNMSGINVTYYKINNEEWETYNGSFNVSSEGINTVYFYSIDNAGNEEQEKNFEVKIDFTPPETTYSINATYGKNGWIRDSAKITLNATDNLSGVNATYYKINGGSWEKYDGKIEIATDGEYTIRFYSIDNAGNIEDEKNLTLKIDSKPPTVSIESPEAGYIYIAGRRIIRTVFDNTYIIGKFTAEVIANDTRSEVAYVEFILNNETLWKDYVSPYTAELPQEFPLSINKLKVVAYDNAGNKKESNVLSYIKIL